MRLGRGGWALCALAAASIAALMPDARGSWDDLSGPRFPEALLGLGCLVQLALSVWIATAAALVLLGVPGPVLRAIAPRALRQALIVSTAGALALSPAHADPAAAPHEANPAHSLVGLRLPDRPSAATPARSGPADGPVTVRRGDTLWAIAARSLPGTATDAQIAAACARWYAANRAVIGADPNLIFPSQRLTPPLGKDPT